MIKLIIFDMDNTLFDTYGQLGAKNLNNMIEKMKKEGLTDYQEAVIREKYMTTGFRIVADQLGLSENLRHIGMETYKSMDLSHIEPYDDVILIKDFKQKKALVTSGTKDVQREKIRFLGISDLFNDIIIDPLGSAESRDEIFSMFLNKYKLKPEEAMVIGDNAEAEIAAGNKLGMITVQIFRRPFLKGKANYYVKDLHEVEKILNEMK